ncbi:hypothetical protein ABW19_dt0200768 [Dactylella cylindrospora]|nr:hypothetical protein ABW19_dt0200768 [Dactylella cylindrospora]
MKILGYLGTLALLSTTASFSVTSAQLITLPLCAQDCISDSLQETNCTSTDTTCLCQSTGYIDILTDCVRGACEGNELQQAEDYAVTICAANGIDVTIPPSSYREPRTSTSSESLSSQTLMLAIPTAATEESESATLSITTSAEGTGTSESTSTITPSETSSQETSSGSGEQGSSSTPTTESGGSSGGSRGSSINMGAMVGGWLVVVLLLSRQY